MVKLLKYLPFIGLSLARKQALFTNDELQRYVDQYKGQRILKIQDPLKNVKFLKTLENDGKIDIWSNSFKNFEISIDANSEVFDVLKEKSIDFRVKVEDLAVPIRKSLPKMMTSPTNDAEFDFTRYHNTEEIYNWCDATANSYDFFKVSSLGETFEGRDHKLVTISKNPSAEYNVVFLSAIHAREWISPASTIKFFNNLLTNPDYDIYLENINWYWVPVMNPDGYEYTWTDDRLWRKTRQVYNNTFCVGADPNRNYPIETEDWYHSEGASDNPCSSTYRGMAPLQEKISGNLDRFINSLKSEGKTIDAFMDVHSYSELMLFPFGYKYDYPDNYEDLYSIAESMVSKIESTKTSIPGGKWQYGTTSDVLYVASGVTTDYLYERYDVKCSFTAELRPNGDDPDGYGFIIPERYIIPVSEEMTNAYIDLAQAVLEARCRT